jgi:hypothetical protein
VEDDAPVAGEVDAAPDAIADDEDVEVSVEQIDSLSPDEYEDDFGDEDPPTVMRPVDPEVLDAAKAGSDPVNVESESEPMDGDSEPTDFEADAEQVDAVADAAEEPELEVAPDEVASADDDFVDDDDAESELAYDTAVAHGEEIAAVLANASATEISIEGEVSDDPDSASASTGRVDSMYAFEHGIAAEPQVGMPVPMPSMAAPPMAPPAPPRLRLAEPPDGLTRPSLPEPEETVFSVDGEVSDVHEAGMFAYEDGLPIPERPPLPDPNRAKQVPTVEAANDFDVQDSESAELIADGYEEVRLSDFAEAVEEG